jgi:ribosomal protein S18 acetylase RimI-like enzyme
MHVSSLDGHHLAAYRELMLEAYEQAPDAFTTTADERRQEPESWWLKRIGSSSGSSTSFGVWDGANLVGSVAIEYAIKPKTRHSALVLGMYVKPVHRSKGAGRSLMAAVIKAASARPEVLVLTLTVTEGNEAALRLYRSVGFEAWGIQPNAIRTESGFKGKVHMSLALLRPTAAA